MSEEAILKMVPELPYLTSAKQNWSGVEVHRYRLSGAVAGGREYSFPQLAVFLPHPDKPYRGKLSISGDILVREISSNVVSIAPAGLVYRAFSVKPREVTAIFLNPLVFSEIARSETGLLYPEIIPQFAIVDPLIRSIGMLLDEEMRSAHPKPPSYGESLGAALAAHIFSRYAQPVYREMRSLGSNWAQLRRSIEYMHTNASDHILLDELAAVANMSKFHFAKSFREAMGIAPHQYLVNVRVEKARTLLADRAMSLQEVAERVGYSDTGQFSAQFTKVVGATPKQYRSRRWFDEGNSESGKLGNKRQESQTQNEVRSGHY